MKIVKRKGVGLKIPAGYKKRKLPYKEEWTEALRSGEYQQGSVYLCSGEKYCCLGVLSKIQGRLRDVEESELKVDGEETCMSGLHRQNPCYEVLEAFGRLPDEVKVYLDGSLFSQSGCTLALLNDEGVSFEAIADIIDELYE